MRAYALAIRHIPYVQRKLWTSVHQAWLWNAAVSERLEKLDPLPAVGDLIISRQIKDGAEQEVEVVTAAMLASCTPAQRRGLSLRVVYPLYGSNTVMPEHGPGKAYAKELEALVKGMEATNSGLGKMPPGAYRTILAKVEGPASCEPAGTGCCEITFSLSSGAYATTLLAVLSANEQYL